MSYVLLTGIVLIFLNIFCASISQRLFYRSKQTSMLEKAQLTANEIGNNQILSPEATKEAIERIGTTTGTRMIVTNTSGLVLYDTEAGGVVHEPVYALFPQVIRALEGYDIFTWHFDEGTMRSEAAVPITNHDTISGCVYIMEYDLQQGQMIHSLQKGIMTITIILEFGLLLFAIIYASRFSKRLKKIMSSMRVIQEGDYTHKVKLGGHDELAVLAEEFNDLTERLCTSENKRRQFVSDASHELKTPLASIKLLSDSILQYDMDPDTVKEFVSDIGNEADRLNRMTTKLLALTKGENDPDEVEAEIIFMVPTIQRVVRMLSDIAKANQVTIHMDIQEDSPILIQEDDLYQITFNLVENGIKYNTPGGMLTVSLTRKDDNAILRVTDTGVGIPEDALGHVFERFYRVDKARSRQSGGSGLGLAIVRSMVQRNHGEIYVQSTVGEGTTFTVEFPRFDTEEVEE